MSLNPVATGSALLLLVIGQSTFAETANVLPAGVSRFRSVGGLTGGIDTRYNSDSQLEPFTQSLNRSVTVSQLAASSQEVANLAAVLNGLESGLGNKLMNSNIYADFEMTAQNLTLAYEYGLTNRLTLGVRQAIVHRDVRASLDVDEINQGVQVAQYVGAGLSPNLFGGLLNFGGTRFNKSFFEEKIFKQYGYEVPHNFSKTELGDLEFGAKYNFYENDGLMLTSVLGGRVPFGSSPSLTNIFDKGSGKGNWAGAVKLIQQYEFNPRWKVSLTEKFTYDFPDTRKRAVPKSPSDNLPSLLPADGQVRNVKRSQPLEFHLNLTGTYHLLESLEFWSGYLVTQQSKDTFSGSGNLYYKGLSEGTDILQHAAEVGVGYSTIPSFRAKKFPIPLEVKALYNLTFAGKNVPMVGFTRVDLIVYF